MIKLYTLNVYLANENEGHYYEYLKSVIKASNINKWEIHNYIPKNSNIKETKNFYKLLNHHSYSNLFNSKFLQPFKNFKIYKKILRTFKHSKNTHIILVDNFSPAQLLVLLLSTIFSSNNYQLWAIHRYDPLESIFKGKVHKIIFKLFKKTIETKLFVDTDLLLKQCIQHFKIIPILLPIPHTDNLDKMKKKITHNKSITCWWPGILRPGKGKEKIFFLLEKIKENQNFKIILSKIIKPELKIIYNNLIFTDYTIDRTKFSELMLNVDLILLPYDSKEYSIKSSGIFVESIFSGNIVLTTENTWMAYELKKYDLNELVIDWNSNNIENNIKALINDKNIVYKLKKMNQNYKKFHNIKNFANILKKQITN